MSEQRRSLEIEPTVELICDSLRYWLKKEVGNSVTGRNHYLDDFDNFQSDITLPYTDDRNSNAQKNRSHYNRLIEWSDGFVENYDEFSEDQKEYAIARQIFCAQMYLSGLFRVRCLMQATDQEDYYSRRLDGDYAGIDFEETVGDELSRLFEAIPEPTSLNQPLTPQELRDRTLAVNELQRGYAEGLHQNGLLDAGQETSPTITSITDMQERWTKLIVDYIVFAASEHDGDLSAVPFLEPKSISDDPQIYYPFADEAS